MPPLVVILGIVMGSAVSIALGLLMTGAVFLILNDTDSRLTDESRPLLATVVGSVILAGISAASFYSELRRLRWRGWAHLALLAGLAAAVWVYWPRK